MSKFLKILVTITACIIHISYLAAFNALSNLNLILAIAILLLFFQPKTDQPHFSLISSGKKLSVNTNFLFYFILIGGIVLDIYSMLPFPVITLSLIATIFLINILFENLFTNRSLYSLILLGLIGTIAYDLILNILIHLTYLFKFTEYCAELNKLFFLNFIWQIIANILFLTIIWFLSNIFKLKLQKTFFLKT